MSVATGGTQSDGASREAALSASGCHVAFESNATTLVPGDTNGFTDVFVRDCAPVTTTRVSIATGGAQATGNSISPTISSDGRFVAFVSQATNLVPGDTNGYADVFVHDRLTGETTRVSVATGGTQANNASSRSAISADGRYVAFESIASDLVAGDGNLLNDIFVHDRVTGATTCVSVVSGGAPAAGNSLNPSISGDGRYVAFYSNAHNLVPGDTNNTYDVFVHDRATGITSRVSVATGGIQVTGPSSRPAISADGRIVVFQSMSTDLVPGDSNGYEDMFVHDRVAGVTTRVSVTSNGGQVTGFSYEGSVSADGRYVAFVSSSNSLVPGDTNNGADVFMHDRVTAATTRVSVASGGAQVKSSAISSAAVSADGRYVAFDSDATDLTSGDSNATSDVFVHDTRRFQRRRISVTSAGAQPTGGQSGRAAVSADGLSVAFTSQATDLVEGDTNGLFDVFLRDRATGTTTRVSVATGGGQAQGDSYNASVSGDGRYVAFQSTAPDLVPGDTNGTTDVFVHDLVTGTTSRVSVSTVGGQANDASQLPAISANGRFVAFESSAANLVPGDTNGVDDVFVHDRVTGETTRASVGMSGQANGDGSSQASISGDGRYVAFVSTATNLVSGDTNFRQDAFVRDRKAGATTRVSVATTGEQGNLDSYRPIVTADGDIVTFYSDASTLVEGDTNGVTDVFVHHRPSTVTVRASVATGGAQAMGGGSYEGASSEGGRYVAFQSAATNLVAGDTNGERDVFVHDWLTGETLRASLGTSDAQANGGSLSPAISADGRVLVYVSSATNLVALDTNGLTDVFVRATTPVLEAVSPRSGLSAGGTSIQIDGDGFQPGTTVRIGGVAASNVDASDRWILQATTPAHAAGLTDITVTVPGFDPERLALSFTYVTLSGAPNADTDSDGIPDAYEVRYSLDPLDPQDADDDPDGDGVSNTAEYAAGTHPRGLVTRYLAEGATSTFLSTEFALVNPGDSEATVLLRFLPAAGSPLTHDLRVPPHSRRTVDAQRVPGLEHAEFSTVLESDRPVVIDRTMRWDATGYGSHMETGLPALSTTWYLAEGATHSGLDLFYLLQNAASTRTTVQVTYFRPAPLGPIVKSYVLEPQSRFNIWVDTEDDRLASTDVSAKIVASQPIAVERAMYLSKPGQLFAAGHQSAGVTAPALSWFLAEGATGPYFDLFVLLANPNPTASAVTVTFLRPDGATVVKTYVVAPQSRFNIWVDLEDAALANTAVSTTVQVTNNVPIVVERALWWPGTAATWHEAHNSAGATSTGTTWVVAGGQDGGPSNTETYVLVANPSSSAATVRATLLLDDGSTAAREYQVAPLSRWNIAVRHDFPVAAGRRFGVLVESVGLSATPVVVESAIYSDAGGVVWAAGANALATKLR